MKHFSIWKKIAACVLFINIVLSAFTPEIVTPGSTADELTAVRMGIGPSLNIGPGGKIFNGGSLSLLADYDNRQMLSMVLQDKNGSLVVIDGGWDIDADHLSDVIRSKGGHVSAWFVTHPHSDHVGALVKILNNPDRKITIDNVYYSLADQSWYDKVESSRSLLVTDLRSALSTLPAASLHTVKKGDEIQVGSIKAKVLNNPYLLDVTSVNNSSVAYKFFLNNVSILVLGDMGPEAGKLLLEETSAADLKSDIVQMSHHGQYGVSREVYAAIKPQIALWPCPLWLWNNDNGSGIGSGDWKTLETRKWMEELGVKVNYCIKDGDQTIN
ncbi:metallo-beta-lactamase superfamily protein [Lacrimispora xylanisolvens]|uniref:Metallo-beta-lactamase superfamily protein n=1 Tax=Lacrimispora xylanisolvens TaxID=384636 RepID=A0A2S6HY29_9FIRM|nr:MBL fold metallo-hydrolase [Hungatella xylanolytica]MBE5986623.1 MBL fold metallo-hydrolase [Paenibacillaceae bacterium]MTK05821.1 MBL fold metallo-hydrolase [Hungatella sp.]PPK83075.1 metallo-beta-lactamase superfamily protein [Hungatella xylanolytica]